MMNVPSAEPSPPPVQGTVLCIEDHAASMDLVEAMLAGFPGVRLLKAYTGQEGIHLAQTQKPDLVLLDMRLPDTSGLEVVRTLNQQMADRRLAGAGAACSRRQGCDGRPVGAVGNRPPGRAGTALR